MIVEKFRRSHPPISHPDREEIPVLTVQMPSDPQVARFYTALRTALGAPLRPRQRLAELEQLALRLLRQAAVRMLVIDELHNVLTARQQAELVRMHATGDYTIAELMEVFSVGRATVYRVLNRAADTTLGHAGTPSAGG